jgi:nitronate monooxygenase
MFLVSYPDLVVAVSEAGGIGTFPALNYRTLDELKAGLTEIKNRTQKPFGVNIILHKEHNPQWQEQLKIALDAGVALIITSLGSPRSIVRDIHASGAKLFCDVTTLRHACIIEKSGADAIIAVAQGAGGHAGAISPFALIPQLRKEINLPVIAAGSIASGAQMAAAFALGAAAVYVGTRFLASSESRASDKYKEAILQSGPEDIVYTDSVSGIPANWIKSSVPEQTIIGLPEHKKWKDIFSAGHGVADIGEILPVKEIMEKLISGYNQAKTLLP